MAATAVGESFRFPCRCGTLLSARTSQAGRKGKCQRCGVLVVIPDPATLGPTDTAAGEALAVREVCSVCQTTIEEDDDRTTCDACGLPFHVECWQENLGCSAYGCHNVNVLKQGPDIRLGDLGGSSPLTRPLPSARSPWRTDSSVPAYPASLRTVRPADNEIPWEYVVLAGSALAALASIVTCGVPSLVMGVAALLLGISRHRRVGWTIPVVSIILSVLGVLFGLCLSAMFWMA